MMKPADASEREKILRYLKRDAPNCVYMLADIQNLQHCENENISVWYQQGGNDIDVVVMKYYDSIQLFSLRDDCALSGVADIINRHAVSMVSGKASLIKRVAPLCPRYGRVLYGSVFRVERGRDACAPNVCLATFEDIPDIVALICSDEALGGHYSPDVLLAQMQDRFSAHAGRSYIIRQDGLLVAHTATYAESDDIAVISGTIVRPGYGHLNYYAVSSALVCQLLSEGKQVYTFSNSPKMIQYHSALHTRCAEYGKMVLR